MSTELFDAKNISDDIHEIAGVPESLNPEIFAMTVAMLADLIIQMDSRGMSMNEQKTRMGRKKDELINELKRLKEEGIVFSGEPRQPIKKRMVKADQIQVRRMH
jgi:predicted transcriptional regulator